MTHPPIKQRQTTVLKSVLKTIISMWIRVTYMYAPNKILYLNFLNKSIFPQIALSLYFVQCLHNKQKKTDTKHEKKKPFTHAL